MGAPALRAGAPSQRRPVPKGRWPPPKKKVYNGKWYKSRLKRLLSEKQGVPLRGGPLLCYKPESFPSELSRSSEGFIFSGGGYLLRGRGVTIFWGEVSLLALL
jgi:hypothetical protein